MGTAFVAQVAGAMAGLAIGVTGLMYGPSPIVAAIILRSKNKQRLKQNVSTLFAVNLVCFYNVWIVK